MQMVKIQIPDKGESANALVILSGRGRIDCYANDVYMVPEPALVVLKDLGISFKEIGRGSLDYAEKTLRDTLAAHPQRRLAGTGNQSSRTASL
jgi:hypothetical protein